MGKVIKDYYRERVIKSKESDYFWQVGKTVSGKNISEEQFLLILENIKTQLLLAPTDRVLDIGCGNGLITYQLSKFVKTITGFDFSESLLSIAEKHHCNENINYYLNDIHADKITEKLEDFDKIVSYEVIQHIDYPLIEDFFDLLDKTSAEHVKIFIGGVLDEEKKWIFFNTTERREGYLQSLMKGIDPLGAWYHKDFLKYLAKRYRFNIVINDQPQSLYTSTYRYDCLLNR